MVKGTVGGRPGLIKAVKGCKRFVKVCEKGGRRAAEGKNNHLGPALFGERNNLTTR
jgi:hypothetical protein